ncbi:tRNA(Met) cytidine acetyltransferase TmcA [Enterobacter cloacae]|uniref:tRNA(Met) cytidine acetyltransferase TmcA n=1 Tax=Enterobacter cloacae TaxID=550 RepID=A0A377LWV5_ENTCL|nr:tRNA(Met) cytidine acetyltransferase TmcA [Enterobacter cloacae]
MAPDALLASSHHADWLIVDEAAAIPGPVLEKLVARFPRVLLTTTVQGYEGTGRGFLLKFCAQFSALQRYTLSTPVRWAAGCPLERVVASALLFDDTLIDQQPKGEVQLTSLAPTHGSTRLHSPRVSTSCFVRLITVPRRWICAV